MTMSSLSCLFLLIPLENAGRAKWATADE